jgi:two-component system cell cycle response regulator
MRHRILSVDDSRTVRIIVRKAFRAFSCDIVEAGNGVEALASIAKEAPALVLLDVTMPTMDGVELLTKLKSDPVLAKIPVVMLTAEGAQDQVKKITELGATDYIVKPFKEDQLIEKVKRIIELSPAESAPGAVPAPTA